MSAKLISIHQIKNIWAVGRNYADHAKEMNAPIPKEPMFFLKAGSCIDSSQTVTLPSWSQEIHYELELALQVDENLNFSQWTLALDLTERSFQAKAKAQGQPWTLAKSFLKSCPLASFRPWQGFQELSSKPLILKINGQVKQNALPSEMIFKPQELLSFVKKHFPLAPGDLILTGTPAGVGPLNPNNLLEAFLGPELIQSWDVVKESAD